MVKFISFFTIVCFIVTNVCSGLFAATTSVSTVNSNNYFVSDIATTSDLFSQYGQVIFNSYKENTPLVVIINDLHNNPNAQNNIEQIISFFKNNSNLDKIILEGAPNKKINTNLLSGIDKSSLPVVLETMLSSGNISGAEAFIIKNNISNSYGLEDWNLYVENINKNIQLKNKYIEDVSYLLNSFVKTRTNYSKTRFLSAFTYTNVTDERIKEIMDFCSNNNINLTLYPQLEKYKAISKYKTKKNINKDFNKFLNDLKGRISYKNYSYIIKLLNDSGSNSRYVMRILFEFISKECPEILSKYKSLFTYLKNIKQQSSINYYLLLNELDVLEKNIYSSNFINKQEKELFDIDKFIHLLYEYSNLSLSYKDYVYLSENKNYLYEISIKYLDSKSIEIINDILDDNDLMNYYEINAKRNNIFYKNLESLLNFRNSAKVKKENKNILNNLKNINSVNIVVVGGFHNHFTDMLKKENISVLSVIPNISNLTVQDNKMLRVNDIVYQNALAPPAVCARTDIYSLAVIINSWSNAMTKRKIPCPQQYNIISSWLNENNIKTDFKFNSQNNILLDSKPIEDVLNQSQTETKNIEIKHKKIFNFLWSINNIKLKIYSLFLSVKYAIIVKFGIKEIEDNIQYDNEENLKIADRFTNIEYQKTVDSLNGDMPDVIIITLDREEDKPFCENKINELLKDKDVHVKYITKEKTGSAVGFVDAMDCLKNDLQFDKSYDKLKTVVIDIPHEDIDLIKQELPLPFEDKNLTPLQLALLNGIRSCNKFGDDGGIAFMEARSIYIGAMNLTGDLTFVSSVVNMEEIEEHNLALIIKNDEDRNEIEKFYYGFKPDDITDIVEKRGIATKNFYDFNNRELKQFEVITGNMLIHFDDDNGNERYKDFIDYMIDMKPEMETAPENMRMSILKHLFKPYLRLSRDESHKTDLARNTDMSYPEKRDFFDSYTDKLEENYKKRENNLKSVKFSVYNHPYSNYTRNSTQDNISHLSKIIKHDTASVDGYEPDTAETFELIEIPVENLSNDSALKRTYEILKQINGNSLEDKKDYDQVIDILMEVFRTTYFQNELYTVENENTAKLYMLISDIISSSINNINEQISKTEDNSIYKQDLENLKRSLLVMQEYTVEYLRLLDHTSTLATLCGYIYPKSSAFETFKIMPINRLIFGFTRGIRNAQTDVRNQMRKVQYLGNNKLMYSLYPYGTLEEDIESFIKKAEHPKEKTTVGMQREWGTRRALQRFSNIITAVQSCVATAFVAIMKSAITVSDITSMFQFLLTGLVPPVFLHRALIWFGWKNDFYNKKKKEIDIELANMKIHRSSAETFIQEKKPFNKLDNILSYLLKENGLNDEIVELAKKNKELIKHYHKFYNLKTISEISDNNKQILKLLPDDNLLKKSLADFTKEYDDIVNELTINYKPEQQKQGQEKKFETPREIRQKKLNAILRNWGKITYEEHLTAENLNTIINNATEIIKLTSFNRKSLKGNNKDDLIDTLQDTISFYDKTIEMYSALPDDKKEELKPEIKMLEKMEEYFVKYYKSLNYMVTLETLYYYRISEGNKMHFLETFKIAAAVRYLFGINLGIYLSYKNLIATMADVKQLGNEIMEDGLYDGNFEKNIDYFVNKNKNPQYFDLGINESWRARKMLSRLVPTILFIQKIFIALTTNSFSVRTLSISFATGVGLTIFLHWLPILGGFVKTMRIKEKKLIKKKRNWNKEYVNEIENIQNSLSKKHLEKLSEVPYGDMPDLIFVTGNKQQYKDEQNLRNTIKDISGYGKFKTENIPIEVSLTNNKGDGNSIIHAFNSITDNYDELKNKYPSLKNKEPQDLKIAILNVDGAKYEDITKPLGFEIIKGKQATAAELAFLNAVGMIQNNYTESGNIVIADPSYLYLGNLYQEENITILGTDIRYEQLEEQNLPLLVANEDNKGIYKIFNKFNISKINNTVVRESYSRRYDISENPLIKLPAYSGLVGVNFDNYKVFELFEIAKNYIENYKGEKEEIDFVTHILIPMLRIMNNEDMDAYIEVLKKEATDEKDNIDEEKRDNIDNFYRGLFNEFADFLGTENLDSIVNLKVEHSSIMTKNQDDGFYDDFVSNLSSLQNDDDFGIFDISTEKIKTANMSFIATIDFDKFTPKQLEEVIDSMPIKKVIVKKSDINNNKDKYEQMTKILENREIKQINSSDMKNINYFELELDDRNIEGTLLDISRNNDENLIIAIDISDIFEDDVDDVICNNFYKLVALFNNEVIKPVFDDGNYVDEQQLNIIGSEEIYNLLSCA